MQNILQQLSVQIDPWVVFGFLAQGVFFLRFVVQWLVSEKRKQSIVPLSFWYLSIAGAILILIYAVHRQDPVFIAGQGLALFIYIRNIMLHGRQLSDTLTDANT